MNRPTRFRIVVAATGRVLLHCDPLTLRHYLATVKRCIVNPVLVEQEVADGRWEQVAGY